MEGTEPWASKENNWHGCKQAEIHCASCFGKYDTNGFHSDTACEQGMVSC